MREELGNLGIYDFKLPAAAFEAADVPGACDDNFAVNRWNGEGHVWAVTPRCFLLKTDARTLERLQGLSEKGRREAFSEARGFCKIRLTEALSRFGKKGGAEVSEDGRDMASDYRYPHEWMVLWILGRARTGGMTKNCWFPWPGKCRRPAPIVWICLMPPIACGSGRANWRRLSACRRKR